MPIIDQVTIGQTIYVMIPETRDGERVRAKTGIGIVTELMDVEHTAAVEAASDVIQIGTRNMQNFSLLKRVGKPNSQSLESYRADGGYRALAKALAMAPADALKEFA